MFVMQRIKIEDREKNNKDHPSLESHTVPEKYYEKL